VSRILARAGADAFSGYIVLPESRLLFKEHVLPRANWPKDDWHPFAMLIILGVMRAIAPYAASFLGSLVGRVLTRSFFKSAYHRWMPIQRAQELNLHCNDCQEEDEVDQNADIAKLAKKVAKALGKAQKLGLDGMKGQTEALRKEGFRQIGAGSGGYAVYECRRRVGAEDQTILLHVTPYGPSIMDVMPRYIVLEREDSRDRRAQWSEFISSVRWTGPPIVEGYCYQGAFFSPYQFAEMKKRYDKELLAYDDACKAMTKVSAGRNVGPPADLSTLKTFLAAGKRPRKRKKNDREYRQLQAKVKNVAEKLKAMMSTGRHECTAPNGVILYFEGLDCSGKSSTGGLIQQVLEQSGFDVEMCQYNRPTTEEQKKRPWMDRFQLPDISSMVTSASDGGERGETAEDNKKKPPRPGHRHSAVVWDRGPAGDFVYGTKTEASAAEKRDRYREFMAFDADCKKNNILFCKLMFVTNRDSIAATLGKRLAQRKMARDLRTWLKASRGDEFDELVMEGLDAIDLHIDPTDFIAFNSYQDNLHKFMNFALNTDTEENPWVVVNTGDRYAARTQLLKVFQTQLGVLRDTRKTGSSVQETPAIEVAAMIDWKFKKPCPIQAIVALMAILLLVYYYSINTDFDWIGGDD
jgi:polyphosphate kinase 2 (PPK2 family)